MEYGKAILLTENVTAVRSEDLVKIEPGANVLRSEGGQILLERRTDGAFEGTSFWLNGVYDWEILEDDKDQLILLPTRKVG